MFAENTGEEIDYGIVESDIDAFESDIESFFAEDSVVGCNVTAPFKGRAYELSKNNCNAEAETAEAVNTLFMKNGELFGYTTDGMGLVADLHSQIGSLEGSRVLLLGAGGATRGVVEPLLAAKIKTLFINNRTEEKAQAIVEAINNPLFKNVTKNELNLLNPDIVINCTSASLTGDLPQVSTNIFEGCSLAYDMVYGKGETKFMEFASTHGAERVSDGFGMLVEQAAAAFTIWTGKKPETAGVIKALRPR